MSTPIFNHGKNAFLALGWAAPDYAPYSLYPLNYPNVTATLSGNLVTADATLPASITNEQELVLGSGQYGVFVGGVPAYGGNMPTSGTGGFGVTDSALADSIGPILGMTNISPYINDIGFPQAFEPQETTTFSAEGVKTYIVGLKGYSLTFSGMYDGTADAIDQWMDEMEKFQSTAGNFVQWVYGPATPGGFNGGSPDIKYYGQAILTKYDLKSAVSGVVSFDSELQVTGPVFRTIL
jgi:hypothetical protein